MGSTIHLRGNEYIALSDDGAVQSLGATPQAMRLHHCVAYLWEAAGTGAEPGRKRCKSVFLA